MTLKQPNSDAVLMEYFSSKVQVLNQCKSICEVFGCHHFNESGCQNYDVSRQATIENCLLAGQDNTVLEMNKKLIYAENTPNLEELKAYVESIEAIKHEFATVVNRGQVTPPLFNWANRRRQIGNVKK
jgi:hypothetical protein